MAPVAIVDGKLRSRCRLHGGLSTGPKTDDGRARVLDGARAWWERWRTERDSVREARRRAREVDELGVTDVSVLTGLHDVTEIGAS